PTPPSREAARMFGISGFAIALAALAVLTVGGIAYAALGGRIAAADRADKRLGRVVAAQPDPRARRAVDATSHRRKSVQETLKEIEQKQKAKAAKTTSPPLSQRLAQAGLSWT